MGVIYSGMGADFDRRINERSRTPSKKNFTITWWVLRNDSPMGQIIENVRLDSADDIENACDQMKTDVLQKAKEKYPSNDSMAKTRVLVHNISER